MTIKIGDTLPAGTLVESIGYDDGKNCPMPPAPVDMAAMTAGNVAKTFGMRSCEVLVKGPGSGRESAVRALQNAGIEVKSIRDVTPIPHNGCRPPKRRRV